MKQIPGVVIGIVKDLEDPDKQGRIRLEFPWMGSVRSSWAPIATPLAGKKRGLYYMPEIDDEALVTFEQGDFDHPYVIGFLWNGVDVPPESDYHNRVLLTPGGHTLRFEDTDKVKKIILKSSSGHTLQFEDTDKEEMIKVEEATHGHIIVMNKDGITITDGKNQHKVVLDGSGITITDGKNSGNKISMASSGVTVQTSGTQIVLGSTGVQVGGSGAVEPFVLGNQFMSQVTSFLLALSTHTHVGNLGAPTSPPVAPMTLQVPLSTKHKVE